MIMRHWMDCPVTNVGRLREWPIFSKRRGETPNAETGEVCTDITCYGRAVVIPGIATEPAVYEEDVQALCVASGQGVLHLDGAEHELRPGNSLVIPRGTEHRFSNPGSEELEFIFSRQPPSSADSEFRIHHWTEDRPHEQWGTAYQGHWYHTYRGPSCEVHIADLPPHKFSHPHSHMADLDEIWYVHKGHGWHWMGRDYRPHYPGWALWLDPTELHALMNPSDENVEYIYATSAPVLHERVRAQSADPEVPDDLPSVAKALEQRFGEVQAAYEKTGVGIYDVSQGIPRVRELLEKLRELV